MMMLYIQEHPELLAKVVPTYPPFGKRMLQDNGSWLSTLKRDDVDLVTDQLIQQQAGHGEPQIQVGEVLQTVNERQRVDEADDAETNRSLRDGG